MHLEPELRASSAAAQCFREPPCRLVENWNGRPGPACWPPPASPRTLIAPGREVTNCTEAPSLVAQKLICSSFSCNKGLLSFRGRGNIRSLRFRSRELHNLTALDGSRTHAQRGAPHLPQPSSRENPPLTRPGGRRQAAHSRPESG